MEITAVETRKATREAKEYSREGIQGRSSRRAPIIALRGKKKNWPGRGVRVSGRSTRLVGIIAQRIYGQVLKLERGHHVRWLPPDEK